MGKNRRLFLADYCLSPYERIENCGILCEKDMIIAVGGESAFSFYEPGLSIVDMKGSYALPGFIDCHIHGLGPNAECSLDELSLKLAEHGITTFLPTLHSMPRDTMIEKVDRLAAMIRADTTGADAPAMHLEGPFLNPEKRGDQSRDAIVPIDLGFAKDLFEAGGGRIKIMTFAPELPHAAELVELMLEYGIIPSMGHSLANEEETLRAIDAGAHRCTYIFNAMPPLHHRESSLTAVALTDDRVAIELIVDGRHLHPRIVDLIVRCKPPDMLLGISNSVFCRNARTLEENGVVRTSDGVIAGATMTLENSWTHLRSYANMPEPLACACITANPAKDLGLITRGELFPGRRADITFFDSKTNKVRLTIAKGEVVYDSQKGDVQ